MPVFEEAFRLPVPRAVVWDFLSDYSQVAPCVPGCESVTPLEGDAFRVRLSVDVGPISTTQVIDLTVTEREAPSRLVATGQGEDERMASRVSMSNRLELDEADGGAATDVRCRVDVKLTGRLATLGEPIMRAKSRRMVAAFAERLCAAVKASDTGSRMP